VVNLAQHIQPLQERLSRTIIERFQDFTRVEDTGVTSVTGLLPSLDSAGTNIASYSGGDCYVAGVEYPGIASGNVSVPTNETSYVWVDDAGVVQSGLASAGWPSSDHCKLFGAVTYGADVSRLLTSLQYRDFLLGYDASRKAIVLNPASNPGSNSILNGETYARHGDAGLGFAKYITVKRPLLVSGVDMNFASLNEEVADNITEFRAGLWYKDTEELVPNGYVDLDYTGVVIGWTYQGTGGGSFRNGTFSEPVLLEPGEYIAGWYALTYEPAAFFDMSKYTGDFDDDGNTYIGFPMAGGLEWNGSAWEGGTLGSSGGPVIRIRGRDAEVAYVRIRDTLAEAPARFLATANMRARDTGTGLYQAIDEASQKAHYSISLDNGAHFTRVERGSELTTLYGGTDFVGAFAAANDHATELVLNAAGFFYET